MRRPPALPPPPPPLPLLLLLASGILLSAPRPAVARLSSPSSSASSAVPSRLRDMLDLPDPARLRSDLYNLTRRSHVAGTPGDYHDAAYVQDVLGGLPGFEAWREEPEVMLTYPRARPALTAPAIGYSAVLAEDVLAEDGTSDDPWRNHTFLGFAPSGTVTAPLVYANYGRPEDFAALAEAGIDVGGSIVLVRYGECFRGLKVMNAEERGAVGTVIYSDPQDDGVVLGPTYPDGPWRPPSAVQRGSVQFMSRCAGDPYRLYATGGNRTATVEDICGYATEDLIPSGPVLPIGYGDAGPLLEALGGVPAPDGFDGGLPFNYTAGPSPFLVTLSTDISFVPSRIPNVIARMEGTDPSGGTVMLGNHRDAWAFGAVDPNSGTASLLEVARCLSALYEGGWRPRRTIVLGSWSGEEYGLLGSTAFAEMNAGTPLIDDLVAYLNVDEAVSGRVLLHAAATHSLDRLLLEAAQAVPAPDDPSATLLDRLPDTGVGTLGSGSDYTAFLDVYGIPSLDMGYRGDYGVYHSVYDSFDYVVSQVDPDFEVHRAVTRLWLYVAYALADRRVLPLAVGRQAKVLAGQAADLADGAAARNVSLAPLEAALDSFMQAADIIDADARDEAYGERHHDDRAASLNRRLSHVERRFLGPGLPRRPYFRHLLQAPGYFTGYGTRPFPGIAEALDWGDEGRARAEIDMAAHALRNAAAYLADESPAVATE